MILRSPRQIDEYTILESVGGSRAFTVYHATDREGTHVAVKAALNRSARDLAHLRREREVCRHLYIPGLRAVRHVGQSADGHIYSVMDWAEHTLRDEMNRKKRFSRSAVLKLLMPVAETLDEMHARQYVHCNLTPDHILIHEDGRVLLAGVAGARRRGQHPAPGDARYSAPERNTAQPTGPWSDIYSLGVIAYEMLTGKLPFPKGSDEQLRRDHAVLTPSLPRSLRRSLGRDASRALLRALAKEPADRFHSATAFLEALRERESTSQAVQHRLSDLGQALGWVTKRVPRALKLGLLVVVAAAAAGGVLLSSLNKEDPVEPDPRTATAEFEAALSTPVSVWTARPVSTLDVDVPPTPTSEAAAASTPTSATQTTPTATPEPEEPPTPTPPPTQPPVAQRPAPALLEPADVTHFPGDATVQFVWQFDGQLQPGETFDLRVWRQGEPAWGIARTTETVYQQRGAPAGPGEYSWQVVVVRDDPNTGQVIETSKRSPTRRLFWD
ncbi:MAG: serine/threonine protein kinase [Anaerolineae bacterium]